MSRCLILALVLTLLVAPVRADIVSFPISSDFDAEFAQAADLIEAGQREQAERALEQIRARSGQPAWIARVEMLLAADDQRRGDFEGAVRHLTAAPAAAIGLEPYRRLRLGEALESLGRLGEAEVETERAFSTDEPFAGRAAAGTELARLLERRRKPREALRVLTRAVPPAPSADAATLGIERIRLAASLGDRAGVDAAARDLVAAGIDVVRPPATRQAIASELTRAGPAARARFARARIAAGDFRRGVALLQRDAAEKWPIQERSENLLALARGLEHTGKLRAAETTAARVPVDDSPVSFEARLLRVDLILARQNNKNIVSAAPASATLLLLRQALLALVSAKAPASVRQASRERLIRIAAQQQLFDEGIAQARDLAAEVPGSAAGFEPLWKLAWQAFEQGDDATAVSRLTALRAVYAGSPVERRVDYWTARCLERQGKAAQAAPIYTELAAADPADLYTLFSRRRVATYIVQKAPRVSDPSTATATFRKIDELLRLRLFSEAVSETGTLPVSRGRDRRLAEAQFALGRFPAAVAAAKRAFPEMGTAAEGHVPDAWRRLYYPIEVGGFLPDRAREFGVEPALLRALVRQESLFEAGARSKAGAQGLTQLMPATARSLSRSVLRQRYRRAFLYDPKINARLGAAYLKRLLDRFGGNATYALAAYNGGPSRMARVLKENPNRSEDEIFESHPAYETRDYVRRVMLFAESYRELYP